MDDSFALIIFGITGNLAQIKLIPALYDMAEKGVLPKNMAIVGIARKMMSKDLFKRYFLDSLNAQNIHHQHEIKKSVFDDLANRLHYIDGHLDDPGFYQRLAQEKENGVFAIRRHRDKTFRLYINPLSNIDQ